MMVCFYAHLPTVQWSSDKLMKTDMHNRNDDREMSYLPGTQQEKGELTNFFAKFSR